MMIGQNVSGSKKKRFLIALVGAVLLIAIAVYVWVRKSNSQASYRQIAVEKGDLDVEVLSTGIVQPENRLEIKPPISGRVEEVLVKEGQDVKKGQVLVRMSSIERAALLDAASARGEGEYKRWQNFYRAAPILAPIDGTIILRSVEPGQSFTTQDAILVMSDRLTVKAQVDETDIAKIKLNQKADVVLDAYANVDIPAHVDKIAYDSTTINNVTTYIVDVLPEETPEFMRSGMTANVKFAVATKKDAALLPASAVKNRDGRQFVLTSMNSGMNHVVEKEITTGLTDGKMVEVLSGLVVGENVLVSKPKNGEDSSANPFSPLAPPRRKAR